MTLFFHLKQLKIMKQKSTFAAMRSQTVKYEGLIIILIVFIIGVMICISLLMAYVQIKNNQNTLFGKKLLILKICLYTFILFIHICLLLGGITIYKNLTNLMKICLHYYYTKLHKKLYYLCLVNTTYFVMAIITQIMLIAVPVLSKKDVFTPWIFYIYFALTSIANLSSLALIYYNIYSIKFKDYLQDIYYGYRLLSRFDK